jgi:hypothetical protein
LFRFEDKVKTLLEYPISEREISVIEDMWEEFDELIKTNKLTQNN